ncbi:MAG: sugar transferase [Gammaproteobacteria bacterium]|nr:sugar transferase [Gammaproteobacteria bacterium]
MNWLRMGALLLALDLAGLLLCFNLVYLYSIRLWLGTGSWAFWGISLVTVAMSYVLECYQAREGEGSWRLAIRTLVAVTAAGILTAGLIYITETWDTDPVVLRGVLPGSLLAFAVWAVAWRLVVSAWEEHRFDEWRWMVIGDKERVRLLLRDFDGIGGGGSMAVLLPPDQRARFRSERELETGHYADLEQCAGKPWNGVVLAPRENLPTEMVAQIMNMRLRGVRIYDLTDFYERFIQKLPVWHLEDGWFALSHGFDLLHHRIGLRLKRLVDVVFSLLLLIPALPVGALVALAIKLDRPEHRRGPVFYQQQRTGVNGRLFQIIKFRTMIENAEKQGHAQWAVENDPRITTVGRVLRLARLDELPQLWNVLRGDMSLIGPRPERPSLNLRLEREIPYYDLRHLVKPGITGWAQVNYSYGASVEDALVKLQYDLFYIKNYSLLLDFIIVFKTLRVVLFGRGR